MKFKMSKLAVAVLAAGAVGSASAVTLNPDGTGEVLIYPYYNVNNNFRSNIEIINTTDYFKIVKIRMRESGLSQDVLDFNIYMSPHDVWKGVIRGVDRDGSIRANIVTGDTTCTLPMNNKPLTINGVGGLTLNDTGWDMNVIYKDVTDADAREGYIEVFEVAVIDEDTYVDMDGDGATDDESDGGAKKLTDAIKHVDGTPPDCTVIEKAWINGTTIGPDSSGASVANWGSYAPGGITYVGDGGANAALDGPMGGLYGFLVLLNTSNGSAFIEEATPISNYSTRSQHYRPDDPSNFLLPSFASGDVDSTLVVDAESDGALIISGWPLTVDATLNDGDPDTPRSGNNPLPIAHVLQAEAVMNSYFINPDFDGSTEWVLTFPMRKHGIFNGQFAPGFLTFDDTLDEFVCADKDDDGNTIVAADATISRDSSVVGVDPKVEGENVCFKDRLDDVEVTVVMYDQEEGTVKSEDPGFGVSPIIDPEDPKVVLPREVNVITFGNETGSSLLGSDQVTNLNPGVDFKSGWAKIIFASKYCFTESQLAQEGLVFADPSARTGGTGTSGLTSTYETCGVPVTGFSAMQGHDFSIDINTFFGETAEHRFMRDVTPTASPGT